MVYIRSAEKTPRVHGNRKEKKMKEKLYTIPINDAFARDCECPVCAMYKVLETNAVEYTMGPSYMEDDVRAQTDQSGFCAKHMQMMLAQENSLGLALILKTHIDKTNSEIDKKMRMPSSGLVRIMSGLSLWE